MRKNTVRGRMMTVGEKQASSIQEFADRYGLARSTVYVEINRGRLKVHKVGKRSLILVRDELEWLRTMPLAHTPAHT